MSGDCMDKTDNDSKNRDRFFVLTGINRFGERLKAAMEQRGITSNVKMGALSDMSDTVIRNYLIGKTYPTLERLAVLAYVLDCSPEWLLTGRDDSNIKSTNSEVFEEKTDNSLTDELDVIIKRLPKPQRDALVDAILQHGVTGIIGALNGLESLAEFSLLSESERQQLIRLHSEIKKGASSGSEQNELSGPEQKQAG